MTRNLNRRIHANHAHRRRDQKVRSVWVAGPVGAGGNKDVSGIDFGIVEAKACKDKPTLIRVSTTIGCGAPTKAGTAKIHGSCLGADEIQGLKENAGLNDSRFIIPRDVKELASIAREAGEEHERSWEKNVEEYVKATPTLGLQFKSMVVQRKLPQGWARAGVIFVLTHDSVLLGEDGPAYHPVEHLASLRAMPGYCVKGTAVLKISTSLLYAVIL